MTGGAVQPYVGERQCRTNDAEVGHLGYGW
jgi:hypothetical protein